MIGLAVSNKKYIYAVVLFMNSNSIVCICLKKKTYPSKGASGSSPEDPLTCHRARRNTHIAMETLRRICVLQNAIRILRRKICRQGGRPRETHKKALSRTKSRRQHRHPVFIRSQSLLHLQIDWMCCPRKVKRYIDDALCHQIEKAEALHLR